MKRDIAIDKLGAVLIDLRVGEQYQPIRDFATVSNTNAAQQNINTRLKTNLQEFFLHPQIGNRLHELVGERNTRKNAEKGATYLRQAITKFNYIDDAQLDITIIPVSASKLIYSIAVNLDEKITFALELDLDEGIRRLL